MAEPWDQVSNLPVCSADHLPRISMHLKLRRYWYNYRSVNPSKSREKILCYDMEENRAKTFTTNHATKLTNGCGSLFSFFICFISYLFPFFSSACVWYLPIWKHFQVVSGIYRIFAKQSEQTLFVVSDSPQTDWEREREREREKFFAFEMYPLCLWHF